MDKLLKWSIAQQSGDKEAMSKMGQPDLKVLEQLFGGPDEPTLMKQAIAIINNPEATLENKEIAFDNFEMLIENLDNANNIENLKMWEPIIDQLFEDKPDSLRIYAASCIGIAVQNNPKAQEDFSKYDGLSSLIAIASSEETSKELLMKSLFAISSYLRNFEPAYNKFDELDGWKILNFSKEIDHKVRLRVLSVISAILSSGFDDKKENHMHNAKLIDFLVSILDGDGHVGCIDKSLNIISQLASLGYNFTSIEIADLSQGLEKVECLKDQLTIDDYHSAKKVVG